MIRRLTGKVFRFLRRGVTWLAIGSVLSVVYLRLAPPLFTPFMLHAKVQSWQTGEPIDLEYHWVAWRNIAPSAALAVVAAEDQRFPFHHGFDFQAMQDAVDAGKRGRRLRGASTITQQLAKNLFLWPERSWFRKGLEAYFTILLELGLSKRRILELYLNVIELGPGVYGVEAAAQRFFGKTAAQLTASESARLAAVLPNPRRFRVEVPSRYVERRTAHILREAAHLGPQYLRPL